MDSAVGYIDSAKSLSLPELADTLTIQLSTPQRNGTSFPNYVNGVAGACAAFDPPGFWCADNPPFGYEFITPNGLTYDPKTISPRIHSWKNPSTGHVHAFHGEHW